MTQWFVPPIVIPAAMVAYFVIDISSVPEIKANPTPKNCLPSSRSKKVTQTE